MFMTQALHKAPRERPHTSAVVFGQRRHTFAQVVARVSRLAASFVKLGLKPGDRVGMRGFNSDRYLEYFYGVWWAGGTVNPVNIRWSTREVAYSLDDCATRILLVDDAFHHVGTELREISACLETLVYTGEGDAPAGMEHFEF